MKLKRKKGDARIPDDSMADIAFLLIIFFILTTTFSVNKGFDFGIPPVEQTAESDQERPALSVIVYAKGDDQNNYKVLVVQGDPESESGIREVYFDKTTINGPSPNTLSDRWEVRVRDYELEAKMKDGVERFQRMQIPVARDSLLEYMYNVFAEMKVEQPDEWYKLPVYVLVVKDSPFEGFIDVWKIVQDLELGLKKDIPTPEQRLATHVPHVAQVEEILENYAGKISLN